MVFQDSSDTFPFDQSYLQNFLPIDSLGQKKPLSFLLLGASLLPSIGIAGYPTLKTSTTISWVRTYRTKCFLLLIKYMMFQAVSLMAI